MLKSSAVSVSTPFMSDLDDDVDIEAEERLKSPAASVSTTVVSTFVFGICLCFVDRRGAPEEAKQQGTTGYHSSFGLNRSFCSTTVLSRTRRALVPGNV